MNFAAIFGLVEKGIGVAHTLIEAGKSAAPALTAIKALVTSAKDGKVTAAEIKSTEDQLDALIDDFNEPMG